jgi:D-alanyl-D-alanine carboxypeptidase (penicillin-binding protein 5/6)
MKRFICLLLVVLSVLSVPVGAVDMNIPAKSAVLMDVATGTVLYEQNPHTPLAPASVTKVMTMLLIMEAIDSGRIRWDDSVTTSESAAAKGGSQIYLKVGETMSVTDMVKSIAVSSANDCACAMAEHLAGSETAFVDMMNKRAKELGMNDTHFVNCTGLDDSEEAKNHRTSAHDIAVMSRQLLKYHPKIKEFTTIWMDTIRNGTFGLSNTNKLIRFYPGATGLKTGFTSGAGYCLSASAERDGLELIAVVMGAESSPIRNEACKQLLDYGFANFAAVTPEVNVEPVPVTLGKVSEITPVPENMGELLVEKAKKSSVTSIVTLEENLTAPVEQGQVLGKLTVKSGEEILTEMDLISPEDVPRLTWWDLSLLVLKRCAMAKEIEN